MLPNLGGLALAPSAPLPTGVTVHPDGSATLTPEEWANFARVMGGLLAQAPAPAPNSRSMRVRHDDDSSEDERAPAPAQAPAPAPPPPAQRRRKKARQRAVAHDDTLTLSDILKEDELAAVLGAIGLSDESKSSACQDAKAWCVLNKGHKAMCDSHPRVWQSLGERIFSGPRRPSLFGKGLIYRTFRDDENAKRAFERMCGAKALGDVLAKRFVIAALDQYDETLWASWSDNRAEITGLGEAIEDLSMDEVEKLAVDHYPNIGKIHDWEADAWALFNSAPSKALYLNKYRNGEIFYKLVNVFFESTKKYLFVDPKAFFLSNHVNETNRNEPELEAIYEIGEVLGVYIVCLWQLERDLKEIDTEDGEGRYDGGWLDMRIDEMTADIQNLRVKVVHAVNRILDPSTAEEITNYDDYDDYQMELYDYETEDNGHYDDNMHSD